MSRSQSIITFTCLGLFLPLLFLASMNCETPRWIGGQWFCLFGIWLGVIYRGAQDRTEYVLKQMSKLVDNFKGQVEPLKAKQEPTITREHTEGPDGVH